MKEQVISPKGKVVYMVQGRVKKTKTYSAHLCTEKTSGNQYILKIANSQKENRILDWEAYILNQLFKESQEQEKAFLEDNPGTKLRMNYHLTFPLVVETFVSKEYESRRILILDFNHVTENIEYLKPLIFLERKEGVRVDQRSSAWIMGKTLKSLIFAHSAGITINDLSRNNILIHQKHHLVMIFDWSKAKTTDNIRVKESEEIAQLAKTLIRTLGWDLKNDHIPEDTDSSKEYNDLIKKFALGKGDSALKAHKKFYNLVNKIWPREYYEFTTHPIR